MTIPLARAAAVLQTEIVGLEREGPVLDEARRKTAALSDDDRADRYVSDFDCHVYYPREVELLFRITGFQVYAWFGDYAMRPLRWSSRQLIGVGRKPGG